jgi:hypothetical protein
MTSKKYRTTCFNLSDQNRIDLKWLSERHNVSLSATIRNLITQAREAEEEDKKHRDEVSKLLQNVA